MLLGTAVEAGAQDVPSIPRAQTTKTVKKSNKNVNVVWGTEYDYLSTRYISYNDIKDFDRGQIRVLKNSIYARHGRIFKDAALREYFNQQSWYRGTRKEIPAKEFNKYENANIAFLLKYE
ncbi:MAG: YARHG domain-containing protein [Prevotella sp.]|nr:YARHG domain-containing protein [Prevotella sp.]